MTDAPLPFSPAAERNRGPILAELQGLLPARARVLEIAAGTGQHAEHVAAHQPGWDWQPTDADPGAVAAIRARTATCSSVRPALPLDVQAWPAAWHGGPYDAVFCANLLHISPWAATPALMAGAARVLRPGGVLLVYGPFLQGDGSDAASNLAFDADLRRRDAAWGVRPLADVLDQARLAGFAPEPPRTLPANNLLLVLRQGTAAGA
ncbi:DUF938 domain-containing protein [Ideonella sp.]|uniref:DUF938 domain-containing protein n=1 Tax=Ideonella sp. TaxID=1929293 RepID=UPI0035AED57C